MIHTCNCSKKEEDRRFETSLTTQREPGLHKVSLDYVARPKPKAKSLVFLCVLTSSSEGLSFVPAVKAAKGSMSWPVAELD